MSFCNNCIHHDRDCVIDPPEGDYCRQYHPAILSQIPPSRGTTAGELTRMHVEAEQKAIGEGVADMLAGRVTEMDFSQHVESENLDHHNRDTVQWQNLPAPHMNYAVSSDGRVMNTATGKELKKQSYDGRYHHVVVYHMAEGSLRYIHRLVAAAFLPPLIGKEHVNHIDGDKKNNRVENLEWSDYSHNITHAWATGLRKKK